MNIESQRMKFESWIKTQRIVIREVSTDGGNTWSRTTVEPSELAMAAWLESAKQNTIGVEPSPFSEPFTNPKSGMGVLKQ